MAITEQSTPTLLDLVALKTLKEANVIDPSMTIEDVKEWIEKGA